MSTTTVSRRSYPNARRVKPSGWQIHSERTRGRVVSLPESPARWDMLLWKLGLKEGELKKAKSLPQEVREFVTKHHDQFFCPVWAIERVGVRGSRFDS